MNIAAIAGIGVVAAAIAILIKKQNPEYSMMISIGAGIILLILILSQVTPAVRQMSDLVSAAGMSTEYAGILFKSLGVCFLTQLACDSCRDVGETALASKIELAGKVAILIFALPLFQKVADMAISLIRG